MPSEGVIKFQAQHERKPLVAHRYAELVCQLIAWREIMAKTGLVGQVPQLYEGAGYGNASGRVGAPSAPRGRRPFVITGTQTSGSPCVSLDDFCLVEEYDDVENRVASAGIVLPSSESLTHGAIYDLSPSIRFVFHAHSPVIWRQARRLRLPTTSPHVAYGTAEMAREARRLFTGSDLGERRIMAMGGHEDGVVVFGRSAHEAGGALLRALATAYEGACRAGGVGLCRTTR